MVNGKDLAAAPGVQNFVPGPARDAGPGQDYKREKRVNFNARKPLQPQAGPGRPGQNEAGRPFSRFTIFSTPGHARYLLLSPIIQNIS